MFSSRHVGRKKTPKWLARDAGIANFHSSDNSRYLTLPEYAFNSQDNGYRHVSTREVDKTSEDPEEYFAENRWGFLLNSLFESSGAGYGELERCICWIESHIDKNDSAWETYSTCERVANLLVFLSAVPLELRQKEIPRALLEFLDDSLTWIYLHLEYYGPLETNNHILNNARVLVMGGVATGNRAMIFVGMRVFRECLPTMILAGGFFRERSSHYQLIVLSWLMDAWRFVATGVECSNDDALFLNGYIQKMLNAASMLCDHGRKLLALIGDVSPDTTPAQSLARLYFLYPDFWPVRAESPGTSPNISMTKDGWFRISTGKNTILGNFPAGRYPPGFPTHGHSDLTSFAWLHNGQEILTDLGRYRYTQDSISLYQRRASGHNVPLVNGFAPLSESVIATRFWLPSPYANATLDAINRDGGIELTHDGFARATPVQRHTRRIVPEADGLVIEDSFDGRGTAEVVFCWHFGDQLTVFNRHKMIAIGPNLQVELDVDGIASAPDVESASGLAPGGFVSRSYGVKQPALGISLRWRINLPAIVTTRFSVKECKP